MLDIHEHHRIDAQALDTVHRQCAEEAKIQSLIKEWTNDRSMYREECQAWLQRHGYHLSEVNIYFLRQDMQKGLS
jgi:hypothetical protein